MADLLEGTGARVVRLPGLGRLPGPGDLVALVALWRLLRRERPDVVHTHQAKAGAIGRTAAWLAGVPVRIHTYHGTVFRGHFGPVAERLWVLLERLLATLSTKIIAINEPVRRDVVDVFRVAPAQKVVVIPLGFDLDALRAARPSGFRRAHGIPEGAPLVGIFGRLAHVKDLPLFLEAAARVRGRRPDARFAVVGGGEEEAAVRAEVVRLGLVEAVSMTGFVRPMSGALAETDVVVLTSRNEGTPVSVVEAMAAGRPVVAVAVGGVVEAIEDGRTGLLVPRAGEDAAGRAATAEALADRILALLDDPARRAALGAAARASVERFDARRLGADLERLYAQGLRSAGRAG